MKSNLHLRANMLLDGSLGILGPLINFLSKCRDLLCAVHFHKEPVRINRSTPDVVFVEMNKPTSTQTRAGSRQHSCLEPEFYHVRIIEICHPLDFKKVPGS